MEGAELQENDPGTSQGGLISPVLANACQHYVFDLWMTLKVRKMVFGEMYYAWYVDDFIVLCQVEEARMVLELLTERLTTFGLQVAKDKNLYSPHWHVQGNQRKFRFSLIQFQQRLVEEEGGVWEFDRVRRKSKSKGRS